MLFTKKVEIFNCCEIMIKNKVGRQSVITDINLHDHRQKQL